MKAKRCSAVCHAWEDLHLKEAMYGQGTEGIVENAVVLTVSEQTLLLPIDTAAASSTRFGLEEMEDIQNLAVRVACAADGHQMQVARGGVLDFQNMEEFFHRICACSEYVVG